MAGDTLSVTMMEVNPREETLRFSVQGDRLEMILDEEDRRAGTPAYVFLRN